MFEENLKKIKELIVHKQCPHINLYCSRSAYLLKTLNSLLPEPYHSDKTLIFNIHLTEIQADTLVCESLADFLHTRSMTQLPKVIVVHQFSEKLNDIFVTYFEEYMKQDNVIFIYLITTMHCIESKFLNKTITVSIPITKESNLNCNDLNSESCIISELIQNEEIDELELAQTIIEMNKINSLRHTIVPKVLLDDWRDLILSKVK